MNDEDTYYFQMRGWPALIFVLAVILLIAVGLGTVLGWVL